MRSRFLNLSYYLSKAITPTIISPKNDNHWSSTGNITFLWNHNGGDLQYKFKIQVFKVPASYLNYANSDDIYWSAVSGVDRTAQEIVDQAESLEYITYGTGEDYTDYYVEIGPITNGDSSYSYDLSSFITENGDYLWRIQTQGFVSREWSLHATDGIIRIDSGTPFIKNISAETIYVDKSQERDINHPSVSVISDLSAPFMINRDGATDYYGIDSDRGRSGLFIYYDYKDNAIIIRGRGHSDAEGDERYYGMITFHSNNNLDTSSPYFYVDEVVNSIRTYTIDRNEDGYGPYEKTTMSDNELLSGNAAHAILINGRSGGDVSTDIPSGFPSFLGDENTVYSQNYNIANGTLPWTSPSRTWANVFPINTFKVSSSKKYKINGSSAKPYVDPNGYNVELRYPPPYQDVFILANSGLSEIHCWGQYEDWDKALTKIEYPNVDSDSYDVINGFDVKENRSSPIAVPNEIFRFRAGESPNTDTVTNCPYGSIDARMNERSFQDDSREILTYPRSYTLSFNVFIKSPDDDTGIAKDSVIKLFLDPNIVKVPEKSYSYPRNGRLPAGTKLAAVEFHMYPETDCSVCTNSLYKTSILVDDVHIGKAAATPKELSSLSSSQFPTSVDGLSLYSQDDPYFSISEMYDGSYQGLGIYKVIFKGYYGMVSEGDTVKITSTSGYWDGTFTIGSPSERDEQSVKRYIGDDALGDDSFWFIFDPGSQYDSSHDGNKEQLVSDIADLDNFSGDEDLIIEINGGGVAGNIPVRKVQKDIKLATPDGTTSDAVVNNVRHVTSFATSESDFGGGDVVFTNRGIESSEGILFDFIGEKFDSGEEENYVFTIMEFSVIDVDPDKIIGDGGYVVIYRGPPDLISSNDTIEIVSESGIWDGTFSTSGPGASLKMTDGIRDYVNYEKDQLSFFVYYPGSAYNATNHPLMMTAVDTRAELDKLPIGEWVKIYVNGGGVSVGQNRYDSVLFNGSFKISIPGEYDYVPYYHPNAVSYYEYEDAGKPVPNVFDAKDRNLTSKIVGWDSIFIKTQKYDSTTTGLVRSDFLLNNDYIKLISSPENSQNSPFYTNILKWDALDNPVGVLKNNNLITDFFDTRKVYEYGFMGHYALHDGDEFDGTKLNRKDVGIYPVGNITKETTLNGQSDLCEIYIKEFSNRLLKRSVQFTVGEGSNVYDGITDAISLYPSGAYTFGGSTSILVYDVSSTPTDHSPSWLYNDHGDDGTYGGILNENALLTNDSSRMGHFGSEGIRIENWMEPIGINNPYGANYLIKEVTPDYIISGTGRDSASTVSGSLSINGWYFIVDSSTTTTDRVFKHQYLDFYLRWISGDSMWEIVGTSSGVVTTGAIIGMGTGNNPDVTATPTATAPYVVGASGVTIAAASGQVAHTGEQITRVLNDIPETGGALFMRGILDKLDIEDGDSGVISGDTFSIGNVFGVVHPDSQNKYVRFFFDVDETMSGIYQYRYFYQEIATEDVDSDYIGNELSSTESRLKIKMQTLNNKAVNYISVGSSDAYDGDLINYYRSPDEITEYYLQNSINNTWIDFIETRDRLLDDNETGYLVRRVHCDIPIPATGYGMVHFQVRDKAGNASNIQQVAIKSILNDDAETTYEIKGATIAVDNGDLPVKVVDSETVTDVSLNEYLFTRSVPRSDMDSTRSIVVKGLFSDTGSSYIQYDNTDNLLIGFSDNYGVSYNRFYPFNSVNSWDFSRPIPIQMKSSNLWTRFANPDWLFDPNDIRHYSVDTLAENAVNTLPGNHGFSPITIVGLMEEGGNNWDITQNFGKSNPFAKKIYEHKEEFIGKKLILGGDLSQSFTILHIFKSAEIHPVTKIGDSYTGNIDGFDVTEKPGRTKVWIVIEDPDAVCAMVLSRRFQNYPGSVSDLTSGYKTFTGWRKHVSSLSKTQDESTGPVGIDYTNNPAGEADFYGDKTLYFGIPLEGDVDSEISEIVDLAMGLDSGDGKSILSPQVDYGLTEEYADWVLSYETFFLDPTQPTSKHSGINTSEGWITRIFKRYDNEENKSYDSLRQHNIVGIEVFDRLVFGESSIATCTIDEIKLADNAVFLNTGHLHYSMGGGGTDEGLPYVINEIDPSSNSTEVDSGTIIDVSDDGACVIVSGDLDFTIQEGYTYNLVVTAAPLQSTNPASEEFYTVGWWPDVDGSLLAPDMELFGSASPSNVAKSKELEFAIISSGAFYIHEEGYYDYKIEIDSDASADFSIDFMWDVSGTETVTGFRYMDDSLNRPMTGSVAAYEEVTVGGKMLSSESSKRFFLNKGWHLGRFRYHSVKDQDLRFVRLMFKKATWGSTDWIPFVASRNSINKSFLGKSCRSIHCKLIDKNDNRYPLDNITSGNRSKESQYFRAICGFDNLSSSEPVSYADRVVWASRSALAASSDPGDTQETDPYYHGKSVQSSKSAFGRTYGGQVFEEAYGIYDSSIFDGGVDLRFWKEISWSPATQADGTSVEFYVRTATSEQELLAEKWNNVGTSTNEVILPAFTDPNLTNNLLRFTQQFSTTSTDVVIKRFIQFKMVLRSRNQDVAPRVNDVTISLSKENSVNFFTTTFNLESNLLRAILTYNGEEGELDSNGVSLSEIQFGICTSEEADGTVSTNFDDYTSIPVNEAFSLSALGVQENDKFRIGIRFISSSEQTPTVDEFCAMWQTEGDKQQVKDIKSSIELS